MMKKSLIPVSERVPVSNIVVFPADQLTIRQYKIIKLMSDKLDLPPAHIELSLKSCLK